MKKESIYTAVEEFILKQLEKENISPEMVAAIAGLIKALAEY